MPEKRSIHYIFGPSLVAQALKLGRLDELRLDLVPLLLRGGVSNFFGGLEQNQIELVSQDIVVETGVTRLIYKVKNKLVDSCL